MEQGHLTRLGCWSLSFAPSHPLPVPAAGPHCFWGSLLLLSSSWGSSCHSSRLLVAPSAPRCPQT